MTQWSSLVGRDIIGLDKCNLRLTFGDITRRIAAGDTISIFAAAAKPARPATLIRRPAGCRAAREREGAWHGRRGEERGREKNYCRHRRRHGRLAAGRDSALANRWRSTPQLRALCGFPFGLWVGGRSSGRAAARRRDQVRPRSRREI